MGNQIVKVIFPKTLLITRDELELKAIIHNVYIQETWNTLKLSTSKIFFPDSEDLV